MKIVIVGAGEVGFHIARRLAAENKDVVVIDRDPGAVRRVSESLDVQAMEGSGSNPLVLETAGIREAEIMLAVTDSDEINLVACLFTDILSPATKKLIRIRDTDYLGFRESLEDGSPHIDTVINPESEVVGTIERFMKVPGAVDVSEFADGRVKLVGISLDREAPLADCCMSDITKRTGGHRVLVAAIVRNEELIIPRGRDALLPGDLVYFICEESKLESTLAFFNKHAETVRHVLIVGGGRIGHRLATALEKEHIHTKIIELDPARCAELAESLSKTVVLNGDGSDQRILEEENVGDMDVVVTLTGDEETNILTSLLAKRMGARKVITRVNKFGYLPLVTAIGIEHVVSPRLSAVNSILHHVRRGRILSAVALKGEKAEVLEAVALPTSDIVGKPLKNLDFPRGAIVIAIIRGSEVIIPTGESIIQHLDRIIILATRKAVPKVEKALAVKLEYF
ncbi:Trk system potassium transporter TrkA [Thermodesulfobacteriota bacterium]